MLTVEIIVFDGLPEIIQFFLLRRSFICLSRSNSDARLCVLRCGPSRSITIFIIITFPESFGPIAHSFAYISAAVLVYTYIFRVVASYKLKSSIRRFSRVLPALFTLVFAHCEIYQVQFPCVCNCMSVCAFRQKTISCESVRASCLCLRFRIILKPTLADMLLFLDALAI